MTTTFLNLTQTAVLASLLVFAASDMAQDGTIYPLEAPTEPNAIPLGTGGVAGHHSVLERQKIHQRKIRILPENRWNPPCHRI